jgi:hypothetical protein
MIDSYQEAQILHSTIEAQRRELEIELQAAQVGVKWAIQKFQSTRKRLTKAEFRAGKIRNMIKKSGYSEILHRGARRTRNRPVIELNGMSFPLFLIPLNQH